MTWVLLHRTTGMILLGFIALHFGTHLFALHSADAHRAALRATQGVYRNPVVEPLLILAIIIQAVAGLRLVARRWREPGKSGWSKAQLATGLYLAYFMLNHTSAALYTRYGGGLETSFDWASGPLFHPLMKPFFYPYYALAVLAVFIHAGAALHFMGRDRLARLMPVAGLAVAGAILASFGGWLYTVVPNPAYRAYYDRLLSLIG